MAQSVCEGQGTLEGVGSRSGGGLSPRNQAKVPSTGELDGMGWRTCLRASRSPQTPSP